eukprot:scaffold94102_cov31-Tisochrysis_lutea.AAC.4
MLPSSRSGLRVDCGLWFAMAEMGVGYTSRLNVPLIPPYHQDPSCLALSLTVRVRRASAAMGKWRPKY